MQDRALAVADKITEKYGKVDSNNQAIDANQIENARVYREQIADNKLRIGDLQHRLDKAQSNQKWIAGASVIAGGFIGYKLCGATQNLNLQNPFAQFSGAMYAQAYPMSFSQPTEAETRLRKALATLK